MTKPTKSIRFCVEYEFGSNDWSVGGVPGEPKIAGEVPAPEELQDWLPFILATMLRDCVVPKEGPTVYIKNQDK